MVRKHFSAPILFSLIGAAFLPAVLYAQADFYKGKNLTIIQGREPGGTGDLRVKALIRVLAKVHSRKMHYRDGVLWLLPASRKAANYLYRSARPDGLTIGNPSVGMISSAVLGESGVQLDIRSSPPGLTVQHLSCGLCQPEGGSLRHH